MSNTTLQANIHAGENITARQFWEQYFVVLENNERPLMTLTEPGQSTAYSYTFPKTLSREILEFTKQSDKRLLLFLFALLAVIHRKISFNRLVFFTSSLVKDGEADNSVVFLIQQLDDDASFRSLLLGIADNFKKVSANSDYPVTEFLRERIAEPAKRVSDFYAGLHNLQGNFTPNTGQHGTCFSFERNQDGTITASITPGNNTLFSNTDSLFALMQQVTASVLKNIDISIRNIQLISFEEQSRIINKFQPGNIFPRKTIQELFEATAARFPLRLALSFGNSNITYADLNTRVNQLAHYFHKIGIQKNAVVAILLQPSIQTIVTILALLKNGCAYLPIDTSYPENRIIDIMNDSGSKWLLATSPAYPGLAKLQSDALKEVKLLLLDDLKNELAIEEDVNPAIQNNPEDPAYIIYTSGSTGKPKGAVINHRNVVSLLFSEHFQFSFSENDVWTMFHRYGFDFSVWEMYGALLYGGKLVILPVEVTRDPEKLIALLQTEGVTVFNQTPTAFYNFITTALNKKQLSISLRYVIFGGEALHPLMLKDWFARFPHVKLVNMYGITETTVHVTYKEISEKEIISNESNIGSPIPSLQAFVVDNTGNPVPKHFTGELWVAGEGVCLGYLNNKDLTAERFIRHSGITKGPIYKSGDLVRINDHGELIYIGRIDDQVKIRGHRIEIKEIEKTISGIEGVRFNLVVQYMDENGEKYICCYYMGDSNYGTDELRNLAKRKLPEYMIPRFFVQVEAFPLTGNGKINLAALPEPTLHFKDIVDPQNETEAVVLQIWKEGLANETFGVTQNFFELGGDSIKILKVLYKINETFKTAIDLAEFYSNPTIREIARLITENILSTEKDGAIDQETRSRLYNLRDAYFSTNQQASEQVEDVYPMSDVQLGMLYNNLRSGETKTVYSDQKTHMLEIADFNESMFRKSLAQVTNDNEILRTAYNLAGFDCPLQILYSTVNIDYVHFDISHLSEKEQLDAVEAEVIRNRENNFNFSQPGLFRVKTFSCGGDIIIVVLHIHHSITDGWSYAIFWKELNTAYLSYTEGKTPPKKIIAYRQRDHIISEINRKQRKNIIDYWKTEMTNASLSSVFPKKTYTNKGASKKYETFKELNDYRRVKELADSMEVSVKSVYFAAYLYFVSRLSGESNVLVGLTTTTRPLGEDSDKLLGCFLNVVPVNYIIDSRMTVEKFILEVHHKLVHLSKYDKLSLFEIERLMDSRKKGEKLVSNFFTYNDFAILDEERSTRQASMLTPFLERVRKLGTEHSDMPFQFTVNKGNKRLRYILQSSESYIDNSLGGNAGILYDEIIEGLIKGKDTLLANLEIIPQKEKDLLLGSFVGKSFAYDLSKGFINYFEEHAQKNPDKIILTDGTDSVSYKELNDKANILAGALLENKCEPQQVIGVLLDRSIVLIISLLAILKTRLVYLPILPGLPEERAKYMLQDSSCTLLITQDPATHFNGIRTIIPENVFAEKSGCPAQNIPYSKNSTDDLAYIIYTSGTTGQPKGVGITQGALLNRLLWMARHFNVTAKDVILLKTPISFDVSIWELFLWMHSGSKLSLLKPNTEGIPEEIANTITNTRVSLLHFVPSMLKVFLDYIEDNTGLLPMDSLRAVISSGEALTPDLAKRFYQKFDAVLLSNLYGPTEATIDVSFYDCPPVINTSTIPIGKPIDNLKLAILSNDLKLQPIGAPGELYILGAGLAKGYINNKTLTEQRFIPCPYFDGALMYKTGDLCRWMPDGNIEYIGRNDTQFKIRGYRIEADEIIHQAKKHPRISDATINLIDVRGTGDKSIVLYYTETAPVDAASLRTFLQRNLTDNMIPAYFVAMPAFPVTMNGKLDISKLPLPELLTPDPDTELPQTVMEMQIADIWGAILHIPPDNIHLDMSFFDLGGHSLNALKVQHAISTKFQVQVTPKDLFENPTVRTLSHLLQGRQLLPQCKILNIPKLAAKKYYQTSYQQKRMYFLQQVSPESTAYNMPLLVLIKDPSIINRGLAHSLGGLIDKHEILRTRYVLDNGALMQVILPPGSLSIETTELSHEISLGESIGQYVKPFDLTKEGVYRLRILHRGNEFYLFFDIHHIAADGVSFEILISDLYQLLKGQKTIEPKLTYKDYCEWLVSAEGTALVDIQEQFWLKELKDYQETSPLPYDRPEKRTLNFKGNRLKVELGAGILPSVRQLLKTNNITMYMFLTAVYGSFLYKWSGRRNNLIGSPIAGRISNDLLDVVGLFANTVIVKTVIEDNDNFLDLLYKTKQKLLQVYDNQLFPFERLVDSFKVKRTFGRNPFFDTCLVSKEVKLGTSINNNPWFETIEMTNGTSKFDLSLICVETEDKVSITFEYNKELFKQSTISKFSASFIAFVEHLLQSPAAPMQSVLASFKIN